MASCNNCNAECCRTMIVLMDRPDQLTAMRLNFKRFAEAPDGKVYAVMESICEYLRGNRCSIYDRRPQRCRDFPKGEEELWRACFSECKMLSEGKL